MEMGVWRLGLTFRGARVRTGARELTHRRGMMEAHGCTVETLEQARVVTTEIGSEFPRP